MVCSVAEARKKMEADNKAKRRACGSPAGGGGAQGQATTPISNSALLAPGTAPQIRSAGGRGASGRELALSEPKGWPADVLFCSGSIIGPVELSPLLRATVPKRPSLGVRIEPVGDNALNSWGGPHPCRPDRQMHAQQRLVAVLRFKPGDCICTYGGVLTNSSLRLNPERNDNESKYVVEIEHLDLVAKYVGSKGRFANDFKGIADGPNAEFVQFTDERTGTVSVAILALKVIKPGEEILVKYGDRRTRLATHAGGAKHQMQLQAGPYKRPSTPPPPSMKAAQLELPAPPQSQSLALATASAHVRHEPSSVIDLTGDSDEEVPIGRGKKLRLEGAVVASTTAHAAHAEDGAAGAAAQSPHGRPDALPLAPPPSPPHPMEQPPPEAMEEAPPSQTEGANAPQGGSWGFSAKLSDDTPAGEAASAEGDSVLATLLADGVSAESLASWAADDAKAQQQRGGWTPVDDAQLTTLQAKFPGVEREQLRQVLYASVNVREAQQTLKDSRAAQAVLEGGTEGDKPTQHDTRAKRRRTEADAEPIL